MEPAPNGTRINIGGYGGTDQAASSDILRPVPADADADLEVNLVDFAILANNWGLEGTSIQNKKADVDNNNIVDARDMLSSGFGYNKAVLPWVGNVVQRNNSYFAIR
jgi:hypothetical protein